MHRVFVYGSLMQGFGNHVLLEQSTFVSEASVQGFALHSLGGFPGAVPDDGDCCPIVGEMYEVDNETLSRLDRLEGHPNFYERQEVEVFCDNMNGELLCWMYIFQHPVNSLIPSGSWREHRATENKAHTLRRQAS